MNKLHRADVATIAGIMISASGLLFGLHFAGVTLNDIVQWTAALIVVCGTIGAVLISLPLQQTAAAMKVIPAMLRSSGEREADVIETVIRYSKVARQRGLIALEQELDDDVDPFLHRGLRLAVDAVGPDMMRTILDAEIDGIENEAETTAIVYETAAGYAPTLGVAGAAVGLVQVMKHLEHLEQVGMGVAAAFVATIYGVLLANLIFLPVATKIRARSQQRIRVCSLMREGALSIAAGLNPMLIRMRLEALANVKETVHKPMIPARLGRAA